MKVDAQQQAGYCVSQTSYDVKQPVVTSLGRLVVPFSEQLLFFTNLDAYQAG